MVTGSKKVNLGDKVANNTTIIDGHPRAVGVEDTGNPHL